MTRYADNTNTEHYDRHPEIFKVTEERLEDKRIKVQVWDTAVQRPRFTTLKYSPYNFRGSHGIMICYDITNPVSFQNVRGYLQEVDRYAVEGIPRMLVGMKSDLKRSVQYSEGEEFAHSIGIPFAEVSARSNMNVAETFKMFLAIIYKQKTLGVHTRVVRWSPAVYSVMLKETRDRIRVIFMLFRHFSLIPNEIVHDIVRLLSPWVCSSEAAPEATAAAIQIVNRTPKARRCIVS